MKSSEFLIEYRGGSWRTIRAMVPEHWPDYVVKDWLYKKIPDTDSLIDIKEFVRGALNMFPVKEWKLETREFSIGSFNPLIQKYLMANVNSGPPAHHPEYDVEITRHNAQAKKIASTGQANQEPIICIDNPRNNGLSLMEGWHRTTQNLIAFPNGWKGRAWIGYL